MFGDPEILLVEDNPYDAELTIRTLRKKHFSNQIRLLHDGQELLDYMQSWTRSDPEMHNPVVRTDIALIMLDLKLPKVGGIEIVKRLKGSPITREIPIVILTSSGEERDIRECYELGVNSYVIKPVDFPEFARAVESIGQYWVSINRMCCI